jgi:diaminopimelate epimerase
MRYTLMSGAGNLFAMVDGFAEPSPRAPAEIARALCAPAAEGGIEPRPDGLILVRPSRRGADCAMEVYNADGSRPETCGNGLRCAAKLAADRGHIGSDAFQIETDAGVRTVRVERDGGRVVFARVHMGAPRVLALDEAIPIGSSSVRVTLVDVGNPHCVLFVPDEREAPVAELGPALERHPRFPEGTNVEFLAHRSGTLFLRVWERGVGETRACGSGACAAAVAAAQKGLVRWPVRVVLPGGTLEVDAAPGGGVELSGPVEELRSGDWVHTPAGRAI